MLKSEQGTIREVTGSEQGILISYQGIPEIQSMLFDSYAEESRIPLRRFFSLQRLSG
jgi:hypothetical protein